MRDIVLTTAVAFFLLVALSNPFAGVLLWTWLSVMNPHRLTWGFAYDFPFAQATAIATFLSLIIGYKKVSFPFTSLTAALIAFWLWINVTMPFAIHVEDSVELWSRTNKTLIMTLVALAVVRTERQIKLFVWVFVLSVAFFGVKGGIWVLFTGGENRVYGPPGSHIEDNNAISVALLMMIPLMAFLQGQIKQAIGKFAMFVSILLCAVSVIASYSRGAFVAGCAMLALLALKSRRRLEILLLAALTVPIGLIAMPDKWWERMQTISLENADQSIQGRFNAWWMNWNLALDRPVFGGGFMVEVPDVFARYAPNPLDVHSAHSNYFQVLGQHGFIGLGLFLLIALLMWRTGTRVIRSYRRSHEPWRADMARALQVSMIGFLVGGLTVNIAYWDVYYFEIVLLVALTRLPLSQSASAAAGVHDPGLSPLAGTAGRSTTSSA